MGLNVFFYVETMRTAFSLAEEEDDEFTVGAAVSSCGMDNGGIGSLGVVIH